MFKNKLRDNKGVGVLEIMFIGIAIFLVANMMVSVISMM